MERLRRWGVGLWFLGLLLACSDRPQPIQYGRDVCSFCKMGISDPRFAAEIVTRKGRVYRFDSIECMVASVVTGQIPETDVRTYWVKDFFTQKWIRAREAYFLQAIKLRSPMGMNFVAFATRKEMEDAKQQYDGLELTFEDLPNVIRESHFVTRFQEHMQRMRMNMPPSESSLP